MTGKKEKWLKDGHEADANLNNRRLVAGKRKFDTIAVHGIYNMEEALKQNNASLMEPVYMSPAQTFTDSDEKELSLAYEIPGWIYSRFGNPSVYYLEETIALLEGYQAGCETSSLVTGSGMSAIFMAVEPLLIKDKSFPYPNIVAQAKIYGGTFHLFSERLMQDRGIEVRWIKDAMDISEWESKIDDKTRFLYGEFPSNPAVQIFDISEIADLAHKHGIPLLVDATCASPAITRPIQHGADIVIQSVSKVMSSSGTTIIGSLTSRKDIPSRVGEDEMKSDFAKYVQHITYRDFGPAIHPLGAIMTLNDLRSLRGRISQMSDSAMKIACFLNDNDKVEKVYYPGLIEYIHYETALKYMRLVDSDEPAFGYMLAFDIVEKNRGESINTRKFYDSLNLVWRTADLGRVKTIATLPAISTHQQQGEEARDMADILPSCVRLSAGLEHPDDIIEDLEQALKKI
ncbi:MAG: O-acetylhomoserine aminocarboxypropyltransferase/cysteine synthase [Acidobacteria bacterium]|nr:O-acetylhomoserine aminocarboxypropyltransferase/cysteine synthase [Acidobacteriota bacterium]